MKTTIGLALCVLLGAVAGCDRSMFGGGRYEVGHGIVVRHLPNETGGFLPWRFRVATPDDAASYVVLERERSAESAEILLEAPLPAASGGTPVTVEIERTSSGRGRLVLSVAAERRFRDIDLPFLRRGAVVNPISELPQDSDGAIVLQYTIPEHLVQNAPSFQEARRLGESERLRLRFAVRPGP
jgi:hypothetical protein